ncbi:MAG TPA: hypothetical protein VE152_11900 [Acidimicrobiales bacterium]|nr:hypothetical protein [Acidimicrobiales bacterium]
MTSAAQAIRLMTDATVAHWHRALGELPEDYGVALGLAQAAAQSALGSLLRSGFDMVGPDGQWVGRGTASGPARRPLAST